MKDKLTYSWVLPPTWFRFLIVILLVLGIFFRFVNLDRKIYWMDEAYTSLRISGYTETEVGQQLLEKQVFGLQDIQKYQRPAPEKSALDTIKGLAAEEPQLVPLYFVLARFWVQVFGNSVAVTRSFSAFLSLLALPCIYWLCLELFESSLVGWIACALLAISPFQLVYAQEARPYSLWTVAILLSSASLLRAIRVNTWRSWGIYAATLVLGFYSHLFFIIVAIAHAIYVLTINSFRWSKILRAYLITSLVGVLAFSPWLVVILNNGSQALKMTNTQGTKPPLQYFVKSWLGNLSRNFIDTGFFSPSPFGTPLRDLIFLVLTVSIASLLVAYSLYFVCRHSPKKTWLFILILIGFHFLAIAIPDLILGRRTSVTGRYMIPCYLGSQLAVAYLLSFQLNSTPVKVLQRKFWQLILLALLSSGIVSCMIVSQAGNWWNNLTDPNNRQLAAIVNAASRPLVVQEVPYGSPRYSVFRLISLSYSLEPKVQYQFIAEQTVPKLP